MDGGAHREIWGEMCYVNDCIRMSVCICVCVHWGLYVCLYVFGMYGQKIAISPFSIRKKHAFQKKNTFHRKNVVFADIILIDFKALLRIECLHLWRIEH